MLNHVTRQKDGFTLIELLVVVAIMATIIGLALPNFLGARERARDTRRKSEMNQLKNALQLYYNDYKIYPPSLLFGGTGKTNYISGCGTDGIQACPCNPGYIDFAAGGAGCDTVYMTKFPAELGSSMFYYQLNSGADFCLKDPLENVSDSDIATSHERCTVKCSVDGVNRVSGTDYAVCSE